MLPTQPWEKAWTVHCPHRCYLLRTSAVWRKLQILCQKKQLIKYDRICCLRWSSGYPGQLQCHLTFYQGSHWRGLAPPEPVFWWRDLGTVPPYSNLFFFQFQLPFIQAVQWFVYGFAVLPSQCQLLHELWKGGFGGSNPEAPLLVLLHGPLIYHLPTWSRQAEGVPWPHEHFA